MLAMLVKLVFLDDFWGTTPTGHLIAYLAHLRMDSLTRFMLKVGADINGRDYHGKGALSYAINTRNDNMLCELIGQGANCLDRDGVGIPDLYRASESGYEFAV
jgi:ankyrin repeat protein